MMMIMMHASRVAGVVKFAASSAPPNSRRRNGGMTNGIVPGRVARTRAAAGIDPGLVK